MFGRLMAVVAALGLFMTALVVAAPVASAAPSCQYTVDDGVHLFDSQLAGIDAAACDLVQSGAHVQLVTVPSLGEGDTLDSYLHEAYPVVWQDPMVMVFAMTPSEGTLLYPGSHWRTVIGPIGGQLPGWRQFFETKDGVAAGDFVAGMKATTQAIRDVSSPTGHDNSSGLGLALLLAAAAGGAALLLLVVGLTLRGRPQPAVVPV